MQQEDVCRILSAAAPESRLAGYAQCFVHIVADSVDEIKWVPRFLKRQFHQPLLAYHLGREAAPVLSRGLPGLPAAEQCIRVLKAAINIWDRCWSPDWSAQFVKGLLLAAPGALLTLVSLTLWLALGVHIMRGPLTIASACRQEKMTAGRLGLVMSRSVESAKAFTK